MCLILIALSVPVEASSLAKLQQLPSLKEWPESHVERLQALDELINHYGDIHNASTQERITARRIALCENSELDPLLQSRIIQSGIREDSWGLAQIHLPSHPSVTREMAQNPAFAVDFLVSNVADGRQRMWTCGRFPTSP